MATTGLGPLSDYSFDKSLTQRSWISWTLNFAIEWRFRSLECAAAIRRWTDANYNYSMILLLSVPVIVISHFPLRYYRTQSMSFVDYDHHPSWKPDTPLEPACTTVLTLRKKEFI